MILPHSPRRWRFRRFDSSSRISCRVSYTNRPRSHARCSDSAAGSVNWAPRARTGRPASSSPSIWATASHNKMQTAIAAYTPNTPWAEMGCRNVVSMNGGGTSSATPQAAAAALWCQHRPPPTNFERWQRAEAVRHPLFTSADKTPPDRLKYFGQGLLRARGTLEVAFDTSRPKAQKDNVWFPLFNLLAGFDELSFARRRMLEVEAAQLAGSSPQIIEVLPDPDVPPEQIPADDRQRILEALQRHRSASSTLRDFLTATSL